MTSEINGINEHNLLISSNNISLTTTCDTKFEESIIKPTLPNDESYLYNYSGYQ